MKQFYFTSFILLLLISAVKADQIDSIAWLIKQGNSERLSQLLAPTVEITMNDQENTYSKRQAIEVVDRFFNEHKPVTSKLLHKVNSGSKFLFGVVIYTSTNGTYRISYTIDIAEKSTRIIELRIDAQKTK
ncbi:MAG: DUF4783 domain-containing protein [Mucilaginibacter sp.]